MQKYLSRTYPADALNTTEGIAADNDGNIYAADTGSNVIRRIYMPAQTAIGSHDSTVLAWTTQYATSCTITPGDYSAQIATQNGSGSFTVTPSGTTTFTVTATGPGGVKTIGSVTVNVIKPNAIHITYPAPGQQINRPDTIVRGTIDGLTGDDIGVVVNGVVANVYDYEFAANHVPLFTGDNNTITAIATSSNDYVATASVTVTADTTGNNVTLTSDKQSGLAPLDFTLQLSKSTPTSTYAFSYTPNNDAMENLGDNAAALQFKRRITQPGLYYITVNDTETRDNGTTVIHSDKIAVMAEHKAAFDTKLQNKWGGMKSGFGDQDITNSLKYISTLSNEKYNKIFTEIADQLPTIAAEMQDIELIIVNDNIAKYRIRREETINGQTLPITYYIYFIKDMNGLWKIDKW